jgi:hypothetical protein
MVHSQIESTVDMSRTLFLSAFRFGLRVSTSSLYPSGSPIPWS